MVLLGEVVDLDADPVVGSVLAVIVLMGMVIKTIIENKDGSL